MNQPSSKQKISYQPTDGLSYDPAEDKYWDKPALDREVQRVFEVCNGCRMCFKYCDSFPKLFDAIDRRHDGSVPRVLREAHRKRPRMKYVATLHVRPKAEIRDPQGEAVSAALRALGFAVTAVRTGKEMVVTFDAADEPTALDAVRTMGQELLANPVIEVYEFDLKELARA